MTAYQRKDGTGGCYSTDPNDKRVKATTAWFQDGWRVMQRGEIVTREPVMRQYPVDFKRRTCGVEPQAGFRDENCIGCVHDGSAVGNEQHNRQP